MSASLEAMTRAAHDTRFAWESIREAHSKASRVAQIELLQLSEQQAKIMQRAEYLLECAKADERDGAS